MAIEFIQQSGLLRHSGSLCVRNDYAHNDCTECIDICPHDALGIVKERFAIKTDACTACGACLGGCPTQALTLENFDPNSFVLQCSKSEPVTLSCKSNTVCLAAFDKQHLATMALQSTAQIQCELSHCQTCSINTDFQISNIIKMRIEECNDFMTLLGIEKHIVSIETQPKQERFGVFKKAIQNIATLSHTQATEIYQKGAQKGLLKSMLLRNALRDQMRTISSTLIDDKAHFFTQIGINFDTCTNCQECTLFCPTKALVPTDDKQGILFDGSQCVGCGICDQVCKANAVSIESHYDIVDFIYERKNVLVHYEMALCQECKCAYPYKGGAQICDRCSAHVEDIAALFTLARDM
ncbi:MAG: hypothetical protein KU37_05690 [Sulfuricurvum sp. PC08-66]|nr:MAG: hypothetical protein KU37_05690 [Sulfuricurvum sp. PC08-66]